MVIIENVNTINGIVVMINRIHMITVRTLLPPHHANSTAKGTTLVEQDSVSIPVYLLSLSFFIIIIIIIILQHCSPTQRWQLGRFRMFAQAYDRFANTFHYKQQVLLQPTHYKYQSYDYQP